jgi:Ca2+:H+ antiporter
LFFQLYSHTTLYEDSGEHVIKSTKYIPRHKKPKDVESVAPTRSNTMASGTVFSETISENNTAATVGNRPDVEANAETEPEEEEVPQLSVWMSIALLVVITVVSPPLLSAQGPELIRHLYVAACGRYR